MRARAATVEEFLEICGSSIDKRHALHCLRQCNFDLDRSVNFYFDENRCQDGTVQCDLTESVSKPLTGRKKRKQVCNDVTYEPLLLAVNSGMGARNINQTHSDAVATQFEDTVTISDDDNTDSMKSTQKIEPKIFCVGSRTCIKERFDSSKKPKISADISLSHKHRQSSAASTCIFSNLRKSGDLPKTRKSSDMIDIKPIFLGEITTDATVLTPIHIQKEIPVVCRTSVTPSRALMKVGTKLSKQAITLPISHEYILQNLLSDPQAAGTIRLCVECPPNKISVGSTKEECPKDLVVAKLRSTLSQILWPLLAGDLIKISTVISSQCVGKKLAWGEDLPVKLAVTLISTAFCENPHSLLRPDRGMRPIHSFKSGATPGKHLKENQKNAISECQGKLRDSIVALFSKVLCLQPMRPSLFWESTTVDTTNTLKKPCVSSGMSDDEDDEIEYDQGSSKLTKEVFDEGTNFDTNAGSPDSLKADDAASATLCSVGKTVAIMELRKLSPSPQFFAACLRPYQQEALAWMYAKENLISEFSQPSTPDEKAVDPDGDLPLNFREENNMNGEVVLFLNRATGAVSRMRPLFMNDCRGGILADEMGLGKTVQLISLVALDYETSFMNTYPYGNQLLEGESQMTRCSPGMIRGGTLIVVPLSLMGQWRSEIENYLILPKWSSASRSWDSAVMPTQLCFEYYGNTRHGIKSAHQLSTYAVVLTTYATISADVCRVDSLGSSDVPPLWKIYWRRVVLDECHNIKNRHTRQARAVSSLFFQRGWCMSGTPIQNSLDDIFSLLQFLRVYPWGQWVWWNRLIVEPVNKGFPDEAMDIVRKLTQPIMLRRTKKTRDRSTGKPIVELPGMTVFEIWIEMSKQERDFYECLYRKTKTEFDTFVAAGTVGRNYTHILALLVKLRQTCCHPLLALSNAGIRNAKSFDSLETMIWRRRRKQQETAKSCAASCASNGFAERQLQFWRDGNFGECVVCREEEISDPVISLVCCHAVCRECAVSSIKALSACAACRSPLSLKDVVGLPGLGGLSAEARDRLRDIGHSSPNHVVDVEPLHCRNDSPLASADRHNPDIEENHREDGPGHSGDKTIPETGEAKTQGFTFSSKLRFLLYMLLEDMSNGRHVVIFSQWTSFLDIIEEMFRCTDGVSRDVGVPTIVEWKISENSTSSTITSIDVSSESRTLQKCPSVVEVENRLNEMLMGSTSSSIHSKKRSVGLCSWNYRRLDGSMNLAQRNEVVSWFTQKPSDEQQSRDTNDPDGLHTAGDAYKSITDDNKSCSAGTILLCSLGVGGVGLNLVKASRVYFLDPWWNPSLESQAYQRVHRIGQTNDVVVCRLLLHHSVEQRMLELHRSKNQKSQYVIDGIPSLPKDKVTGIPEKKKQGKIGMGDLKAIFAKW